MCKFKWVFMAILIGFEHQEYRCAYYNLNGFLASRISKLKWVFMAILTGFEHQEY